MLINTSYANLTAKNLRQKKNHQNTFKAVDNNGRRNSNRIPEDVMDSIRYAYGDDLEAYSRIADAVGYPDTSDEPDFDYMSSDTIIPVENLDVVDVALRYSDSPLGTYYTYIRRNGPSAEINTATVFRTDGRTVLKNSQGVRCLKLNDTELPPNMRGRGTYFLDLRLGTLYKYNSAGTAVPQERYNEPTRSREPEERYDEPARSREPAESYADRMSLLDRLHCLDYFDRYSDTNNIAPELKRQLSQMDTDGNARDTANYLKSQGRILVEALGGNWLILMKDEELLPDMRINGMDYYMTLDGRLYVDSKNCPEYPVIDDDNDEADDYYEPMFDENPSYIWVNGFGRVEMRNELERCKNIRNEQTTCHYADENYYFRVLSKCRDENYTLIKDVNGIYYAKVPANKLPWNLQEDSVYMNLRDGSWHTENSEALRGRADIPQDQNTQRQINNRRASTPERESASSQATNTAASQNIEEPVKGPDTSIAGIPIDKFEKELASTDAIIKSSALEDLLKYILSGKFDPNFKDSFGRNVIHLSMLSRDERIKNIIARAMGKGISINSQNIVGQTPLMMAIKNFLTAGSDDEKSVDLSNIKFILEQNPDVNIQDNNGQTAFHLACMSTSAALLTLILSRNPNILLKDVKGNIGAKYLKTDALKEVYEKFIRG